MNTTPSKQTTNTSYQPLWLLRLEIEVILGRGIRLNILSANGHSSGCNQDRRLQFAAKAR